MSLPAVKPFQPQFNYPNNKLYQMEVYPVQLACTFTVAVTNGLGITGLTGAGIANVFMHTSTTPAVGNYAVTNPNPASGLILVQLQNQFSRLLGMNASVQSPVTGSNLTSVTLGSVYVITAVGTTTTAQWVAKGLPAGVTPAAGQTFLASASGALGGNGTVKIAGVSGIAQIEVAGSPILQNANVYQNGGGQIILQCLGSVATMGAYTPAGTNSAPALTMNSYTPAGTNAADGPPETFTGTPATLTGSVAAPVFTGSAASLTGTISQALAAPSDGTVIRLLLLLSNSSVSVNGQ
jgi:hypothetical protein